MIQNENENKLQDRVQNLPVLHQVCQKKLTWDLNETLTVKQKLHHFSRISPGIWKMLFSCIRSILKIQFQCCTIFFFPFFNDYIRKLTRFPRMKSQISMAGTNLPFEPDHDNTFLLFFFRFHYLLPTMFNSQQLNQHLHCMYFEFLEGELILELDKLKALLRAAALQRMKSETIQKRNSVDSWEKLKCNIFD